MNNYLSDDKLRKKKLFLFVHYYDVHSDWGKLPYDSPSPFKEMFSSEYSDDFDGGHAGKYASEHLQDLNEKGIGIEADDLNLSPRFTTAELHTQINMLESCSLL